MKLEAMRAFSSRNFRYFFAGQFVSLVGTWMQKTAVSWVIYAQTHSKFMLGVSVFATLFHSAIFSLLGGVVSDRYNRYRVLLLTQVLSMVQAALLALAVFWQPSAVWAIIVLSAVLGRGRSGNLGTLETLRRSPFARVMFMDIGVLSTLGALYLVLNGQTAIKVPAALASLFVGSFALLPALAWEDWTAMREAEEREA